jgi:hypothetical protein
MEAICSSETSADTQRTTRRNIPEDDNSFYISYLPKLHFLMIYYHTQFQNPTWSGASVDPASEVVDFDIYRK